jgi:hypothetical protein
MMPNSERPETLRNHLHAHAMCLMIYSPCRERAEDPEVHQSLLLPMVYKPVLLPDFRALYTQKL